MCASFKISDEDKIKGINLVSGLSDSDESTNKSLISELVKPLIKVLSPDLISVLFFEILVVFCTELLPTVELLVALSSDSQSSINETIGELLLRLSSMSPSYSTDIK